MAGDFLPRLVGVKYLTQINVRSDYGNLKLDDKIFISNNIFMSIWQVLIHKTTI